MARAAGLLLLACFFGPQTLGEEETSAPPHADLVILGGRVWIGRADPVAQRSPDIGPTSVAVRGERIVAVGDEVAVRAFVGPQTRVLEARGRRIIPGITDSHTHLVSGGLQLDRLALRDVPDRAAFVTAVAAAARKTQPGQWLLGGRWSVESWSDPQSPRKEWIDPATEKVPVFLSRMDGHQALVNSAALEMAGIDRAGPADPVGGEIERDPASREPTGILKESAMELVRRHIPPTGSKERYQALLRAMRHANELGITSVHDMSDPADLEVFDRARGEGRLKVRITAYVQTTEWAEWLEKIQRFPADDQFRIAGFKGYMDGSLGSRTAYMHRPFSDAGPQSPYPRGQLTAFAAGPGFLDSIALAHRSGVQVAIHAIGDEANHLLLDAYQAAQQSAERRDARHRVEHAQHLMIEDIPRLASLGVVASMQPFHKADDGRYAEVGLGSERLEGSYAFRRLLYAGVLLCFGSDWPVVTLNPFAGLEAAVTARTVQGDVWLPTHSLDVEEALGAYTVSPPRAIHREHELGTIEPGKLADLVMLEDDPLSIPSERLGEVRVAATILGGRVVYQRSD